MTETSHHTAPTKNPSRPAPRAAPSALSCSPWSAPCWWWGRPTSPAAAAVPLTNLAHLDFLGTTVTPPTQADHTTYRPDRPLGVLWTYADRRPTATTTGSAAAATTPATDTGGRAPSTPTT